MNAHSPLPSDFAEFVRVRAQIAIASSFVAVVRDIRTIAATDPDHDRRTALDGVAARLTDLGLDLVSNARDAAEIARREFLA